MVILSSTGAVAPLQKALDQLEGGNTRTPRIAISFDDGTRDFLSEALPVLQKFHLPATLYVSPLRVGQKGFLNWKELVEISQSNVNIESHGLDHRSLAGLTAEELHRQLGESKRLLEQHLDKEVTSIAYPYGTVKDFDEGVKEAVRKAGYRSGCSSVNGINKTDSDRYELRRTKIEQADLPIFTWILAGYLDVWSIVDRRLGNLQNRYL
jgi:peptidoglycan/xylan/chitin deacetylase (PgdA/CDA1 family)